MGKFEKKHIATIEFNNSELKIVQSALELLVISYDKELKKVITPNFISKQRIAIKLMFKVIDKSENK